MSTLACLSFFAALSPPNPEPMITTRCRRSGPAVVSGWGLMFGLLLTGAPGRAISVSYPAPQADTCNPINKHVQSNTPERRAWSPGRDSRHARRSLRPRLQADQRAQPFAGRADHPGRVEGHVDDHAVDSRVEHFGLDLVGDRFGAPDRHVLDHFGGD